jgi:EmrB/QacA subfamily drug resistance transporter
MHTSMTGRQLTVLLLLLASQFMLAVDFSILNVALPRVADGLGFRAADVQWIATSFALCAAGFTLLFGRLGDTLGRRRLFLVGMGVLGAASLLGGVATTPEVLLTARVLQGLATAAVTPAALSLLTGTFPEGPLRRRALGLNSVMMSLGFTGGAVLGGVLTDLFSWRAAFLVNVPIAAAVIVVALVVLRETAERVVSRLDVRGAVLVTAGLVALVFAATRFGEHGIADPFGLVSLALAALLVVAFGIAERGHPNPLVPLGLLRRPTILGGHIAGFTTFTMETGLVFLSTMYLQHVLGLDPMQTGLMLGAMGAGAVLGGIVGPRVIAAVGVRNTAVCGLALQGLLTGVLLLLGSTNGSLWLYGVVVFTAAVPHTCAIVAFMVAATSGLPDREQGLASGLATMTQQIGMALGTPALSAVAVAAGGLASLGALRTAIGVDAALVLAGAVGVAIALRARRPAPVQTTPARA